VAAAMAALLGARGGVELPAEDRRKVYNHLAQHYRQFEREPPTFRESAKGGNNNNNNESNNNKNDSQKTQSGNNQKSQKNNNQKGQADKAWEALKTEIEGVKKSLNALISEVKKLKESKMHIQENYISKNEILKSIPEKWIWRSWSLGPQRLVRELLYKLTGKADGNHSPSGPGVTEDELGETA